MLIPIKSRHLGRRLLGAGVLALPLVIVSTISQPGYAVPDPSVATTPLVALSEVDRLLRQALQSPQEADRKVALQQAQQLLDQLPATAPAAGEVVGDARWKVPGAQQLERIEAHTLQRLRQALMLAIWASPYDGFDQPQLADFDTVADALRVLRELTRLSDGDAISLRDLQTTYWDWLLAYRGKAGIGITAIDERPAALVFEQRLMRDGSGQVQLYQLIGNEDLTLRWVALAEQPVTEVGEGGLTVRLDQEKAPVLLVLDGPELSRYLADHAHWLAAVQGRARLVLLYREDYLAGLRAMPLVPDGTAAWPPYVIPVAEANTSPSVRVIDVVGQRELGRWELSLLDDADATALTAFLYQLISAIDGQ